MFKKLFLPLILVVVCININAQSTVSLVNIPASVFVNEGKTDFEKILKVTDQLKKSVRSLYNKKILAHEYTDDNSTFEKYWTVFSNQWAFVELNPNKDPLLLFRGMVSFLDEKEYVELYDPNKEKLIFAESGNLLAYRKHPFTNETVLYVHKYPCCKSASHNVITLRYLNGEIHSKDKFFVGRDSGDMVGPFYPTEVNFPKEYHKLETKTLLRWSPAVVEKDAFLNRAETNAIIHYEKGAVYQILKDQGEWQFVIFYNGISEEPGTVINYVNFKNRPVYGWIQK